MGSKEDANRKRAEAMKRRWADPEYKARLSAAQQAAHTPESNVRRSESAKRLWQDPEFQARVSEGHAASDPDVKARQAEAARKLHDNPVSKERHREAMRRSWENPSPGQMQSLVALHGSKPVTGIESLVLAALAKRGVACIVHCRLGRYEADLYIPALHLDIECDGSYWHRKEHAGRDMKRDQNLASRGYTVLRLTEEEITAADWSRLDAAISTLQPGGLWQRQCP